MAVANSLQRPLRSLDARPRIAARSAVVPRPQPQPCSAPSTRCQAEKRTVEAVPFGDIYTAIQERMLTQGTVARAEGRIMAESIRSPEHGQRALEMIARHVAKKREQGALEQDWPVRKKWLARICEQALRIPGCKPLILDVFGNAQAFALSTYFAAEMVEVLSAGGAEPGLLGRMVELFRMRRPAGDKGVASAYHKLLDAMKGRKEEAAAKAVQAALRTYLTVGAGEAGAGAAPAAAAAAPAAAAEAVAAPVAV